MTPKDTFSALVFAGSSLFTTQAMTAEYEIRVSVPGLAATEALVATTDEGVAWYGEVPASDLISGEGLSSALNLSAGTPFNSDAGWLHVRLDDGPSLFIAKKPLRYEITAAEIKSAGLYEGRFITLDEEVYRVRNLEGAVYDPPFGSNTNSWDSQETHNSEWNRIFYRLVDTAEIGSVRSSDATTSEGNYEVLHPYSYDDLGFVHENGHGILSATSIAQEPGNNAIFRGAEGVSRLHKSLSFSWRNNYRGWRPVLERVQE